MYNLFLLMSTLRVIVICKRYFVIHVKSSQFYLFADMRGCTL